MKNSVFKNNSIAGFYTYIAPQAMAKANDTNHIME